MRSLPAMAPATVLSICLFLSALTPVAAAPAATTAPRGEVGVRASGDEYAAMASLALPLRREIDYGTFRWVVFDRATFDNAVAAGLTFSSSPVDFRLTLGGQRFDPTIETPAIPVELKATTNGTSARLVQMVGPTKAAWRKTMETAGVRVVQYIHPFTYVVWGDQAAVESLANETWVRWTGAFEPAYGLLPRYRGLTDKGIASRLLLIRDANQKNLIGAIKAAGATDVLAEPMDASFVAARITADGDAYATIAKIPGVYSVKTVPTDGGARSEMSCLVNVNNIDGTNRAVGDYPTWLAGVGVDGTGVIVADVDLGVLETHPDLVGRMLSCVGTTCSGANNSHGTRTAGIIAADGASLVVDALGFLRGLGVAPGANLIEQIFTPFFFTEPNGMLLLMRESHENGATLSSNSWGPAGTPLGYDDDTRQIDVGVRDVDSTVPGDQSLTYVLAIMNGFGGFQTQGTPDEAKNLIDVGSTKMQNNDGTQNLNIDDVSANSAHGPCLDGRNLPHLVAPGCNVDSTALGDSYNVSFQCGTSFACPQVAGGVALFVEYYRLLPTFTTDPSPAMVKAAIVAVSRSLEGHLDADDGVLNAPYDSKQGYGRFDLEAIVDPQDAVLYFDQQVVFDDTGDEWSVVVAPDNSAAPMRIMLAWTDAPGHGLGGATPAWNNDLDLVVEAGALTYRGNNIASGGFSAPGGAADGMHNTEAVFLGPTAPATTTIRILAANITSDGLPNSGDGTDQDFALVCYNCTTDVPSCATALGDLDSNSAIDGLDASGFVSCFIGGDPAAAGCPCADMNDSGTFEQADIDSFVSCLLGMGCP